MVLAFTCIYFAVVLNEVAACFAGFGRQSLLFKIQEFLQGTIVPKYGSFYDDKSYYNFRVLIYCIQTLFVCLKA